MIFPPVCVMDCPKQALSPEENNTQLYIQKPSREAVIMWKERGRCAVAIGFDFDAETLWLARGLKTPSPINEGEYIHRQTHRAM